MARTSIDDRPGVAQHDKLTYNAESLYNNHNMADAKEKKTKSTWPELIGKSGEEAKAAIVAEVGDSITRIGIIQVGSMMAKDYRQNRVRIIVDDHGIVVRAPTIG